MFYLQVSLHVKMDTVLEHTFLAKETGGGGNEQPRVPKLPCSRAHGSTLVKHFKPLRGVLVALGLLPALNPPNRGAPGVPGVAGVEGTELESS